MHTTSSTSLSLHELRELYLRHAEKHYRRRSGEPTREHLNMRAVLDRFEAFAGEASPATKINRHQVRAWLDQLAAEQLTRTYINACLSRLRRFVRWSADLEYLPMTAVEELRLVRPLQPFRTDAREPEKPKPPSLDEVAKVLPQLPAMPRDVLQLSRLTGARPSELLELTNAEVHLDAVGARLTPLQHKCAHRGLQRVIPLTAAAIAVVERHWRPLLPLDRLFATSSKRGHYTIDAYRAAVKRACRRAGVAPFRLYDVRHAVARHVRKTQGLDAAQALLGHAHASTTEIYAPLDAGDQATFEQARSAAEGLR